MERLKILSTKVPFDIHKPGINLKYQEWTKALQSTFDLSGNEILEIIKTESKSDPGLSKKIEKSLDTALSVKTVLKNGKEPIQIFSGNVSAIVLNSSGEVVYNQNLINPVAKGYDTDLRPIAYKKAAAAMALDVEFHSNMDNTNDFEMLQNFGYKFHKGGNKISIDGENYYIGVSGALPSESYAKEVGILSTESTEITNSSLQGAFDDELGKLAQFYLNNPRKENSEAPIIPRPEIVISSWSEQ